MNETNNVTIEQKITSKENTPPKITEENTPPKITEEDTPPKITEEDTPPKTTEEDTPPKITSKGSLIEKTSMIGTPQKIPSKASSVEKTPSNKSLEGLPSKESSKEETLEIGASQTSAIRENSTDWLLQKVLSKEFSIEKTPTEMLSSKSLHSREISIVPSIDKMLPINEPTAMEKIPSTNAITKDMEETLSNEKNSMKKEARKRSNSKSSLHPKSLRKSQYSDQKLTRKRTLSHNNTSKRKSESSKDDSFNKAILKLKWANSKISLQSTDVSFKSSPSFVKLKKKSRQLSEELSEPPSNFQIHTLRRSIKTWKQQQNSLKLVAHATSTESLADSIYQETDEDPDDQAKRFELFNDLKNIPDINDLVKTTSSDETLIKENDSIVDEPGEQFVADGDYGNFTVTSSRGKTLEKSELMTSGSVSLEDDEIDSPVRHKLNDAESSSITLDGLLESDDDNDDDFVKEKFANPIDATVSSFAASMLEINPKYSDVIVTEIIYDRNSHLYWELNASKIKTCQGFIKDLINRTVAHCEEYSNKLHRFLDKEKLINQLYYLVENYRDEIYKNTKLEKLTVEFFLRKKRFSAVEEPKEKNKYHRIRLSDALNELDRNLKIKKETVQMCQSKISILKEKAEEAKIRSEQKLSHFESVVRNSLCNRDGYDHLKKMVDVLLRSMEHFRHEMYEMRLALLLTQHQFADIKLQFDKMEDLGEGLSVHEYLSTQALTETLARKIAERNGDLKRLSDRLTLDVHAMAHWKCKEQIAQSNLNVMKLKLQSQELSKLANRKLIYKGKLKHNKILKEIKQLKSTGYLMHYPALMHDYDRTTEILDEKRESIAKLREEYKRINNRIRRTEVLNQLKLEENELADIVRERYKFEH